MHHGPQFLVLDERIEVFAENLGRLDQGHFRIDRAVGPNLHRQLVVVGLVSHAGLFDLVADLDHRAEGRVDRDNADFLRLRRVLRGRNIPAAVLDDHLQQERHVVGQRRDHVLLVDHLDLLVRHDVGARHRAAGVLLDPDHSRLLAVVLHHQRFHVEHDVGRVVHQAGQGAELVLRPVQLDLRDGTTFQTGQENAAQAVADRHAESPLEGLDRELAVNSRQGGTFRHDLTGQLESAPSNTHL